MPEVDTPAVADPDAPSVEVTPPPEVPPAGTGDPVEETPPGDEPPGDAEEPAPPAACSGPDGTARLAWSYDAAWDQTVDFRGTLDADGQTYWTECDSSYWSDKEPHELQCHLVSATHDGAIRYRLPMPRAGLPAVHSVDTERLYATSGGATVSAHAREDGRELWSANLATLRPGFPPVGASLVIDAVALGPPYVFTVARHAVEEENEQSLLVALRASTGAVAWTALTPPVRAPLVLDAEGNVYGGSFSAATQETTLFSYTPDGQRRWQTRRAGQRRPSAVDGGRLLLERAEVADAATGSPLATLATASPDDSYVALGSSNSPFGRAVFQASGVLVLADQPCTAEGCPEALHPGRTFLYGFNPEDGALRWHQPIGAWPMAPVLTQRDSLLLVDRPPTEGCEEDYSCTGDDSHHGSFLRELDVKDGRELAACALPGTAPYITPPALHRGRVVLGAWTNWLASNDWTRRMSIRAFELSVPTEPATSGWVTAGGGNSRSGTPRSNP
ncbi:PQQ-binding-like beta-propeller repeat protein [Pyxidicoccus trucidator]|uniref:outer membrane protein assembly factor BamB family protein n=1 Tax=Pyxidicoccus trucidator TaxID=2709662 RepID=UPI001F08262C|nr:PQQ-binding-like beta-propeller repeat protein [Pyxidicoccus trucidator]